jgi:PST family polysaccharide transporter
VTTLSEGTETNPPSESRPPRSDGRRVFGNFLSLSIVQFANYLAPLITLPYLFQVLGPSKYGLTELARAVSVYFLMLTDYGFSLSATREISVHRDDPRRVSELFSCIMLLKFLLLILSAALLSALVLAVPKLRADWPVYFLSFGNVVGMWLFPIWLFQGLERMKYIPLLNVTAKTLVVICVFVFIHSPADYLFVPAFQSGGTILIGLAGLILALCKFRLHFHLTSVATLTRELANGWHIFLSKMAVTLYTTSNVVILGLVTDSSFVAYYTAGDKIVRAVVDGLQVPLSQAIFPHIGRLASQSRQAALRFTARVAKLGSGVTLALSVGLYTAAPWMASFVMHEKASEGLPVIRILSLLPFIVGLSNIFGTQIMVNFGLKQLLTRILATAGVLNVLLAFLLAGLFQHVGVAVASLITEIVVTVAMFVALRRHGLNVFGRTAGAGPSGA